MIRNWSDFKYEVADFLFSKELDEAYEMGIRLGAESAAKIISFQVDLKESKQELTRAQKVGYDKAAQIVQDCKPKIQKATGAVL